MTVPRHIECYDCGNVYLLKEDRCTVCGFLTTASQGCELGPTGHRIPGGRVLLVALLVFWGIVGHGCATL